MKRCTKCVLPETFPGISYDDEGVCNFCRSFRGQEHLDSSIEKYRKRFEKLLDEHRREGGYDCLMAYSGGKDSTYTLVVLKETYDLSVLALTIDNGFISPRSLDNIRNVVEGLGIDHILYKPRFDILRKLFSEAEKSQMYALKTLERASTICTSCMGIVKFIALRMAVESNIPFIVYGWSPGQAPIAASIFRNNPSMIRSMQKALFDPMYKATGSGLENYFLTAEHFTMEERFPYNISPLAFLQYDEDRIYETIKKLGWEKPTDTDPNSTNCLLNAFANKIHVDSFGYNPYAFELAKLVREGYMDRDEAIERLEKEQNEDMIACVKRRLEID
jgi:tRNA(Ile)-lysidine synthase TilS/MesJ